MSVLAPTALFGRVTWAGLASGADGILSGARAALELDWGGPVGDVHHGLTRPACVRVKRQHARGVEIRNVRQLSIVSAEELAALAAALGVPALAPEWLGATLVLEGIPDFTAVPPSSRLIAENGTALVVDMENAPCRHPAEAIERHHPGHGRAFPELARGRRGVTAWVERPGRLALGDRLRLHVPPLRPYPHA